MNKLFIPLVSILLLAAGCKSDKDDFEFKGTVCGYHQCTLSGASISEQDWGYIIDLESPSSIGGQYFEDIDGKHIEHNNAVLLYKTRTRLKDGETVSGRMYLDEEYSKAYCSYHAKLDIPEGVCTAID